MPVPKPIRDEIIVVDKAHQHYVHLHSAALSVFCLVQKNVNSTNSSSVSGSGARSQATTRTSAWRRWSLQQLGTDVGLAKEEVERQQQLAKGMAKGVLDPKLVEDTAQSVNASLAETAKLLEELLGLKVVLEDIETQLPPDLLQAFSTGKFIEQCNERYDDLATSAQSCEEGLTPDELFPVILEMTQNAPWEITWEQCVKFADIFDADGNGMDYCLTRWLLPRDVSFTSISEHEPRTTKNVLSQKPTIIMRARND